MTIADRRTGTVKVLNSSGHTTVRWDTDKPESIIRAETAFNQAVDAGLQAFDTSDPAGGTALDARSEGFSTEVKSVTFVPQLAGG